MSAPNNHFPSTSPGFGHMGPRNYRLDMQALTLFIRELGDVIGSKEVAEAEIHAIYQARIAELEEENKQLVQHANDALLIQEAVNALNSAIYGQPMARNYQDSIAEAYERSPILQQRILNLQTTLERVRRTARRKEQETHEKITRLESLAHANIKQLMGDVRRNVEVPVVGGARETAEIDQTTILQGSKLMGGNLVPR
ncbi:hypothetical protein L211DRAFT_476877 [Terfezia boudieri ATCC MYA-4762]|uniref:Uncharacterized protein n=1 Tax=Terfezia boudieri ATCC MYA-4762 TaxID=1051890 RepID=A0A3N4LYK9_9PEZI|nr:hypothetical protein L211DRAFT_476877 [Terfezia boudieri ATCC MYA-4762]